MSAARAWVVVLAVLAAVLGRVGAQAEHEHRPCRAGEVVRCEGTSGARGGEHEHRREGHEGERRGCGQCESYMLAGLGVAPGLAGLELPAVRVVGVEGAWAWVERGATRGVGSVRARGPPGGG